MKMCNHLTIVVDSVTMINDVIAMIVEPIDLNQMQFPKIYLNFPLNRENMVALAAVAAVATAVVTMNEDQMTNQS